MDKLNEVKSENVPENDVGKGLLVVEEGVVNQENVDLGIALERTTTKEEMIIVEEVVKEGEIIGDIVQHKFDEAKDQALILGSLPADLLR